MDAEAIGETLKSARRRAGMTQQELAQAADVPQPSIARIESGAVVPRTSTLITLLRATGHRLTVEPMSASADREPER
jgi:predicted transcriptional regulator